MSSFLKLPQVQGHGLQAGAIPGVGWKHRGAGQWLRLASRTAWIRPPSAFVRSHDCLTFSMTPRLKHCCSQELDLLEGFLFGNCHELL